MFRMGSIVPTLLYEIYVPSHQLQHDNQGHTSKIYYEKMEDEKCQKKYLKNLMTT